MIRDWTSSEADTTGAAASWFVNNESAVLTKWAHGAHADPSGSSLSCVAPLFPPQWATPAPSDAAVAEEIKLALQFDLPAGSIRLLAVDTHHDGGAMYTWHSTRWLCKWSCADGTLIWKVRVAAARVLLADGAHMRKHVVITASGGDVLVWDGKDGACIRVLPAISRDVTAMCANENYLCIAERKRVHVFTKNNTTEQLTPAFVFEPPISFVTSIALTCAPGPETRQSRLASCLKVSVHGADVRLRAMTPRACDGFRAKIVSLLSSVSASLVPRLHGAAGFLRAAIPRTSDDVLVCGGFREELVSLHIGQRSSWKELNVRAARVTVLSTPARTPFEATLWRFALRRL